VDHALRVGEAEAPQSLPEDFQRLVRGQRRAQPPQALGERFALDKFHYDVEPSLVGQELANLDNVGMLEPVLDFGLVDEASAQLGIESQLREDGLDGHHILEDGVHATIDDSHAAASNLTFKAVTGDLFGHFSFACSQNGTELRPQAALDRDYCRDYNRTVSGGKPKRAVEPCPGLLAVVSAGAPAGGAHGSNGKRGAVGIACGHPERFTTHDALSENTAGIMAARGAMPASRELASLRALQSEIEDFLQTLRHPVVVEDAIELFDLTAASWRLRVEFGKLLLEVWNPARSIVRRVEEVAYRDRGRMGLFVRKPGGRESQTLELRDLERAAAPRARSDVRARFRREVTAMLGKEFPGWRFERVSNRSDREHSFSALYTRGLARRGPTAWAFLALSEEEAPAAADAALAFGLIWVDWLRSNSDRLTISGLKLFLPKPAVELTAHRAAHLNHRALQLEIHSWRPGETRPVPVDLKDYGNVATRLAPHRQCEALRERHQQLIARLVGEFSPHVDVVADADANLLSLRVLGLEVARIEGLLAPRIFYGLEGSVRSLEEGSEEDLRRFLGQVVEVRRAQSRQTSHEFYRLQAERWLEALLVRDISKVDPALSQECVYPQVPAFSGSDRGVIDILSATDSGRLAVIELKLDEDIHLPLQGLDYWLRVKWLHERGQFLPSGYFPGMSLAPDPPRLYLVSPAFRFHSTTDRLARYLHPSIEVVKVGLNQRWREEVQVLFRRTLGGHA